MARVGDFFIFC